MAETFFDREKFYDPVPEDGAIEIQTFLAKTKQITEVFEYFGKVFSPVRSDMNSNIEKLNKVIAAKRAKGGDYKTIKEIIEDELAEKTYQGKNSGTVAGVWLGRGLKFMYLFFEQLVTSHKEGNMTENNVEFVNKAYDDSLKKHHNFISKGIFKVALHAAPNRSDLCRKLMKNPGNMEAKDINRVVLDDMAAYLVTLKDTVDSWNSQCLALTGEEKYNSL